MTFSTTTFCQKYSILNFDTGVFLHVEVLVVSGNFDAPPPKKKNCFVGFGRPCPFNFGTAEVPTLKGQCNEKIATDVNDAGGKLPPVSTTPAANLLPVSTTILKGQCHEIFCFWFLS